MSNLTKRVFEALAPRQIERLTYQMPIIQRGEANYRLVEMFLYECWDEASDLREKDTPDDDKEVERLDRASQISVHETLYIAACVYPNGLTSQEIHEEIVKDPDAFAFGVA